MSGEEIVDETSRQLGELISYLKSELPGAEDPATRHDVARLYTALAAQMAVNVSLITAVATPHGSKGYEEAQKRAFRAVEMSTSAAAEALSAFLDQTAEKIRTKFNDPEEESGSDD